MVMGGTVMRRRGIGLIMIIMLLLTSAVQAKTYTIGTHHWIGFSPNDVAAVKGFWKALGLDVKLLNFTSEQDAHNALINGRVDIGFQMLGTWIGFYLEGSPITLIAEMDWSHGGDKVIIKNDIAIQDLQNQPFGVYIENPAVLFFLYKYLTTNGLKLSDVQVVGGLEAKELADSFIYNRLKGLVLYDPDALRAEKEGNGKVVGTTASYAGCMPEGAAVRTDMLKTIPKEDLFKLFQGWLQAVEWISDDANWKEYTEILNTHTFETYPDFSDEELREMYAGIRWHDVNMLRQRNNPGGELYEWLQEVKMMLQDSGRLTRDFDPAAIFDNTAISEFLQTMQ